MAQRTVEATAALPVPGVHARLSFEAVPHTFQHIGGAMSDGSVYELLPMSLLWEDR